MASLNHLIIPTRKDIKAARNYLEWSQKKLGVKCSSTEYTINSLETKRHKPTKDLLDRITEVFAGEGIKFNANGGFRIEKEIVEIFEGAESPIKLLNDVLSTCIFEKNEVLFLGSDDQRSSDKVLNIQKKLYEENIPCKYLVSNTNNYILGPVDEYKKIDKTLFLSKDAILIYKNKISFLVGNNKKDKLKEVKNIVINDEDLTEMFKKYFYRLWDNGKKIEKSETKQMFFKKSN